MSAFQPDIALLIFLLYLAKVRGVHQCRKWINRLLLPVIYRAGLKALFHCLFPLSGLNLELLRVISSRERAAAAVPGYFCLCWGFYAFCFIRWRGLLLIPEGGGCWDAPHPCAPSPPQPALALQNLDLFGKPFSPPTHLPKSFFLYWKHTFLLTEEAFL